MANATTMSVRKAATKGAARSRTAPVLKPPEGDEAPPGQPGAPDAPAWMSPKEASERVFDVPTGRTNFRYAMLRRHRNGHANTLAQLLQAKLQPREPTGYERAAAEGWAVTARAHALVRARGAPDVQALEQLAEDFDGRTVGDQKLLAAVITILFPDMMLTGHELMQMGSTFCALHVAPRRLTSVAVLHVPGDVTSLRPPHLHLVVFARAQGLLGWGVVHPDLAEERHTMWTAEWDGFLERWNGAPP